MPLTQGQHVTHYYSMLKYHSQTNRYDVKQRRSRRRRRYSNEYRGKLSLSFEQRRKRRRLFLRLPEDSARSLACLLLLSDTVDWIHAATVILYLLIHSTFSFRISDHPTEHMAVLEPSKSVDQRIFVVQRRRWTGALILRNIRSGSSNLCMHIERKKVPWPNNVNKHIAYTLSYLRYQNFQMYFTVVKMLDSVPIVGGHIFLLTNLKWTKRI